LDFTHLNPEANYLTKMSEDIFNLKTGNSVLQVDYDHNTGKFTEPEIIESSDNIIVCGLHPLYNDNSLYNLSIYMDTNEDLKKKWKISRDVSKRGYTEEKVLKQIEYRKEDYYKFIYPQREISDIIINFHTNGDLGINDNNLSLRVFVKEKFNVMGILSVFQDIKLDFEYTNTKEYHILFFKEYQDVSIPIDVLYSNYYDYIIYIILNIKKRIK
jgi:uridine kinase